MFKKLSEKIGFTQTEIKVILFLIIVLLIGSGIKLYISTKGNFEYKNYDYSSQDSLFLASGSDNENDSAAANTQTAKLTREEVLDLKKNDLNNFVKKSAPDERSININKATVEELTSIPGIGKVTAQNIVSMRNQKGRFKRLEELLEVKRVGNKTFKKIKRYLYID